MGIRDSNNIITLNLWMLNIVECMKWNKYTNKMYKTYITTQHSYTLPLQSNPNPHLENSVMTEKCGVVRDVYKIGFVGVFDWLLHLVIQVSKTNGQYVCFVLRWPPFKSRHGEKLAIQAIFLSLFKNIASH